MGNGVGKLNLCFAGDAAEISRRHDIAIYLADPLDEGLGHSFCYIRPDPTHLASSDSATTTTTAFKSISGASLSANTSTPLSTTLIDLCPFDSSSIDKASSFESSVSFAAIPLQPIPRNSVPSVRSGPIPRCSGAGLGSGPIERGFLSGPIERSFISGPLDHQDDHLQRYKPNSKKLNLMKNLKRAITKSILAPIRGVVPAKGSDLAHEKNVSNVYNGTAISDNTLSSQGSIEGVGDGAGDDDESFDSTNVQWAQGKAGEDRVHIVVSEEHGWVFVGIYDGFNGPDATDYLLNNLYFNVHKELKGLIWNDKSASAPNSATNERVLGRKSSLEKEMIFQNDKCDPSPMAHHMFDSCPQFEKENDPCTNEGVNTDCDCGRKRRRKSKNRTKGAAKRLDRERLELDRLLKEKLSSSGHEVNHSDIMKALSVALRKTEESFLEIADLMLMENPELSLMGSCVLVMLMKGDDVYLMNVGDSRAVLASKGEPNLGIGLARQDLERIKEETFNGLKDFDDQPNLTSVQLTKDHSTSVEEEVRRIKNKHRDDPFVVTKDRVKGSLKVTRAFGAGFLKQPKWNNALLEVFRVDYVGGSPYISCLPSLYHHRLSPRDRFLILSSDGLYQYFTNEEAISEVEMFITLFPEGDPAQHLVEEVLFRAAKKAGMDFHELLDIPQGDRRKYHDDVSIIIVSFEGRIWRSSV